MRATAPGLALAALGAAIGFAVHELRPGVPVVLVAISLGLVVGNTRGVPLSARPGSFRAGTGSAGAAPVRARPLKGRFAPGLDLASGPLLRVGIVLLGFELILQDIVSIGARGLAVVVAVVIATFFGTQWAGRRLGVSEGLSLLVATGFSICGVSAIAAVRDVSDVDEEEVTYAIALVTLCGSLAIVLLPALKGVLGLDDRSYGVWVGASVHDVAQVVATSSVVGGAALAAAIVVKLTRVLLLGPLVAWIGWSQGKGTGVGRAWLVPPFVLAFVGAALLRSADLVPAGLLPAIADAKLGLLALALFAVGARVEVRRLVAVGVRPLLLGLCSWAIVAAVAYAGVRLVWT
jgi:uncharacterized integral membrane protein (TIGR00698 family)